MRRYSRYSRYRTKTHDKCTISHVFPRYSRYSRYQTVFLKLQEIISTKVETCQKCSASAGHFLLSLGEQLSLPIRASEVYYVSEVIFYSEVLPIGKVSKLNFTWCIKVAKQLCTNFTASQLHFRDSENFTTPLNFLDLFGHCNTEITSNIYVHIFKEYKAKMAESIEHDLL